MTPTASSTSSDRERLLARFAAGDRRALARLITLLDNQDPQARGLLERLGPPSGKAAVVGVTGPPGVGKSTLLGGLIAQLRARGRRVAVLAVDPESPISGGALLGDRCRMSRPGAAAREPADDDSDVFIRSLSSRGSPGGLSASVRVICRLLERFGYDLILVETVGVGQGEMAVLRVADVVMLMVMPGAGDEVQWEKAGIIEVAHLVVINKADYPGVDQLERQLRDALAAGQGRPTPPLLRTVATAAVGVEAVIDALEGILAGRPAADWRQLRTEILQEAEMLLGERLRALAEQDAELADLARAVADGRQDLASAAAAAVRRLLPRLGEDDSNPDSNGG